MITGLLWAFPSIYAMASANGVFNPKSTEKLPAQPLIYVLVIFRMIALPITIFYFCYSNRVYLKRVAKRCCSKNGDDDDDEYQRE